MLVALQVPKFQHLGHLHLWSTAGCAEPVETCRVLCHNRSLRNPRGCARIPFRWPTRCGLRAGGHQGPGFMCNFFDKFCKVSGLEARILGMIWRPGVLLKSLEEKLPFALSPGILWFPENAGTGAVGLECLLQWPFSAGSSILYDAAAL